MFVNAYNMWHLWMRTIYDICECVQYVTFVNAYNMWYLWMRTICDICECVQYVTFVTLPKYNIVKIILRRVKGVLI